MAWKVRLNREALLFWIIMFIYSMFVESNTFTGAEGEREINGGGRTTLRSRNLRKVVWVWNKNNYSIIFSNGTACKILNAARRERSLVQNSVLPNWTVNGTGWKSVLTICTFEFWNSRGQFCLFVSSNANYNLATTFLSKFHNKTKLKFLPTLSKL